MKLSIITLTFNQLDYTKQYIESLYKYTKDFELIIVDNGSTDETVDYIVDAIDTVTAKIELVIRAQNLNIPIISCMGTGNKLEPTKFEVSDIYKTSVCPLAKVMRRELKKRNIKNVKVVYSKEEPVEAKISLKEAEVQDSSRRSIPASCAFVPSVAGLILAGEVIRDLTGNNEKG